MSPLTSQILEQKRQHRQTLSQLPYPEKVRIVEKLRDASLRIADSAMRQGLRKQTAARQEGADSPGRG
jgi:hypothetical protein